MAKNKLTRRQKWRIQKIQEERTARIAGKDAIIEQQFSDEQLGHEQEGLVISHFGQTLDIEDNNGKMTRCFIRSHLGSLVTGDRVTWRAGNKNGVVVAKHARISELSRPNSQGEMKPIAANIDNIIITIAPEPVPQPNLIDRYLVAAELSQLNPIILLNKSDLINQSNQSYFAELVTTYTELGYSMLQVSSITGSGMAELKSYLNQKISAFVGQSGVGKSSIINHLMPSTNIKTNQLSSINRLGQHTTTTARLFHFPEGGDLIDSPGIRAFGLWHIQPDELIRGFKELVPLIGDCRFRNCNHLHEPDCAFKQAVEIGLISLSRWQSFLQIYSSLEESYNQIKPEY